MQQVLDNHTSFSRSLIPPKQAGLLAVLFLVAQILCCFHTHEPLIDSPKETHTEADCSICLLSHMPFNTGEAAEFTPSGLFALSLTVREPKAAFKSHNISPQQARAPPHR